MRSMKKITSLILSTALVMSLTPIIPDMGIKAYAAELSAEPSVQVYADVAALTSDIFTPKYKEDDSTQNKWVYNNARVYRPFGSLYVNTVTPDGYYVDADGAKPE